MKNQLTYDEISLTKVSEFFCHINIRMNDDLERVFQSQIVKYRGKENERERRRRRRSNVFRP